MSVYSKKKSQHVGKLCGPTRKRIFKSRTAALIRAGEILEEGAIGTNGFRAYECLFCGGYHLTKKL